MLYAAIVMGCMAVNDCSFFEDDLGPYPTQQQCLTRLREMAEDVSRITNIEHVEGRCVIEDETGRPVVRPRSR